MFRNCGVTCVMSNSSRDTHGVNRMSFTRCQFENWGVVTAYDCKVVHRVWSTGVKENEPFKHYKLSFKKKKKDKTKIADRWRYYRKDIMNTNNCLGFPRKKQKKGACYFYLIFIFYLFFLFFFFLVNS